jgi:rubrerythrin
MFVTYAACWRCWDYSFIPHDKLVCHRCFAQSQGEIAYACSQCGVALVASAGGVCPDCQTSGAA